MAFNAATYRANKHAKNAWAALARAKAVRDYFAANPDSADAQFQASRIKTLVWLARNAMHLSLGARRLAKIEKGEV